MLCFSEITQQTSYAHPCLVGGCYLLNPLAGTLVPPYLLEEIPHWLIIYSKGKFILRLSVNLLGARPKRLRSRGVQQEWVTAHTKAFCH